MNKLQYYWRWFKWFLIGTHWYGEYIWKDNQRNWIGPNMTKEEAKIQEARRMTR